MTAQRSPDQSPIMAAGVSNIEPAAKPKSARPDTASSDNRQIRLLSQSIRLEESGLPKIALWTTALIVLSVTGFIAWAAVANINELARAPGEIVPANYEQIVQHLEGGIITKIYVREGDFVEKGQPIARLQAADVDANLERTASTIESLSLQIERLEAFVEDREPNFSQFRNVSPEVIAVQTQLFRSMIHARASERDILEKQLAQQVQMRRSLMTQKASLNQNLELLNGVYERRSKLQKEGYLSDLKLMETELRLNTVSGEYAIILENIAQANQSIAEFESRIQSLMASRRDEALARLEDLRNTLHQNQEVRGGIADRSERLTVRSPVRGIIKSVDVNTIGGIIPAGGNIASVIPLDNALVAQVRIPPQYVGRISVGQPVLVNVSAFDFARYGTLNGTLEHISAMTFKDDRGARYYKGRIRLERDHFGGEPTANRILPGMTVTANIITGEKTLLEYLLKPIHIAIESAMTEY